jgi:hypothetical protein
MTVESTPSSKAVLTLYAVQGGSHLHALVSLNHDDYRVRGEELNGIPTAVKDIVNKNAYDINSDTLQFLINQDGSFQTFITSTRQPQLDSKMFIQRIVKYIISQAKAYGWVGIGSGNKVLIDKLFSKAESESMISNM